ncbi:MAG TPA: pilus assembly protein PilM, partial [Thermodesulfobacteriota bacterium]|nr:pilus assembly protein PilM [Thermodesulfobacteriota bacterium]
MNDRVWGLDIGSTGIKAVEITRTWRGPRLTNYGFFPFTGGAHDGRSEKLARLQEILPRLKRNGDGLILPIPSHRTMVHRVALPFAERKKNEQVVKYEVEPLLPVPIDAVVVDYYSSPRQEEKEVLVFAVQKEIVREELAMMKE